MAKLYTPRDYQDEALDSIGRLWRAGGNRMLGHAATGLGKTVIALHLPNRYEREVRKHGMLFLCHRREILWQAYEKFKAIYPDLWIGIEMGEMEATGLEDIVFVSVESMGREYQTRVEKYKRRKFAIVVADEGHHVTTDSTWDNILTYFGVGSNPTSHYEFESGRSPLSLFLTATPQRNDGQALTPFLDDVAFSYNVLYGIRNGWLTDIRAWMATSRHEEEREVDFLIRILRDYTNHKDKTMLFAGSVAESELLSNTLNEMGVRSSGHVDAHTDEEERRELVTKFRQNELQVMCNRLVFTEGFDDPAITAIIDNGPTKSTVRHLQKLGRGLRPHPDAQVDKYDTAEERREAIRLSPKKYLKYVATFDATEHSLDVVATLIGRDTGIDAQGSLVVSEVIDVLEEMEDEQPDRPTKDVKTVDDLQVRLKELDLWNQTIYNEDLHALTTLNWLSENYNVSLWIPENPFTKWFKPPMGSKERMEREQQPVVLYLKREEKRKWSIWVVAGGGWSESFGHPIKARKQFIGETDDLGAAIKKTDQWLEHHRPELFADVIRGPSSEAPKKKKTYMRNAGIQFAPNVRERTADVLIADYRTKRILSNVSL